MGVVYTPIVLIKKRRFDSREGGHSGGEGGVVCSASTVESPYFAGGIAVAIDPPEYLVFQNKPHTP